MSNEKKQLIILNIVSILALLVVIFPLLLISKYDYPSADDWSYGEYGYQALRAGGGLIQLLGASFRMVMDAYHGWDGRFAAAFLDSLQPGIWGEQFYRVTPWILIGVLILSEILFGSFFIRFKTEQGSNDWLWLPIIIPVLILQILFCPSPEEGFYWYTGGMNYTFVYGLSLILLTLFVKLGLQGFQSKRRMILITVISCILAVFVGGANYSTSLSSFLGMCVLSVLFFICKGKSFLLRTWCVTLITGLSLLICLVAPGNILGNANRLKGTSSAVETIFLSLLRTATNIYSWTTLRGVLLTVVFICPFICMAVRNAQYKFRRPFLFTLLSFSLYASQMTPNLYAFGTPGGGRQAVIIYFFYVIWLVANIYYWIGWLYGKTEKIKMHFEKVGAYLGRYLMVYCVLTGTALVAVIYFFHLRDTSSYKAYRDWRQGWAQQYAAEWDARLEVLNDDSVKEVEFAPLTVQPEMLLYTDLQEETGYYWVNDACAKYYGKIYIHIVPSETQ